MKLTIIAGARPNFMKIAPIIHSIDRAKKLGEDLSYRLIHTGQHYDKKMSETFFDQLNIPHPNANLGVGSGSQAEQTAGIMIAFENELDEFPTDLVIVVGDVTSTMACTIVAKKMGVKVAHIEAGIRSFDISMPEEINRMVTDSITDYFFITSEVAGKNLNTNGISNDRIFYVGNVMIDTLMANMSRLKAPPFYNEMKLEKGKYFVLTMHRPANVDEEEKLSVFLDKITSNKEDYPVIFPIHPRTKQILDRLPLKSKNLYTVEPLGYLEFNYLVKNSFAVITDSGGITEETTVMNIPCLTLRDNTERPETIDLGTNELVGTDPDKIHDYFEILFNGNWKNGSIPPLWDGKAAERIVREIINLKL